MASQQLQQPATSNGVNIYWITHEKPEVSKIIRIKFYAHDGAQVAHVSCTAQLLHLHYVGMAWEEMVEHHLRSSYWINYSHSHNIHKYISFMK